MDGEYGWIEDDLELTYHGSADTAESIEGCIDEVEAHAETTEEAVELLIVEVPDQCAVREAGRETALRKRESRDGSSAPPTFGRGYDRLLEEY